MAKEEPPAGWGRDEALLVLSLLFEGPGGSRLGPDRLLELAEFIGRSPGSVSFKVAGFRALRGGDSPRTRRVSAVQRQVHREFNGRPRELMDKAERLRADLLRRLPSARAEHDAARFPDVGQLQEIAERNGFPWKACLPLEHGQGRVRGIALASTAALQHPGEARAFCRELARVAGARSRASLGFSRLRPGRSDAYGRGLGRGKFPTLHPKEITGRGADRFPQIAGLPHIHHLSVLEEDARRMSPEGTRRFQEAIREVLGLSPTTLCPACTMLLGYVAHQVERKGGIPSELPEEPVPPAAVIV